MGILRADVVSHSSLEPTGSVLFDGTTDMITIPSDDSFAFGTADWSVEGWFYFTDLTGQQTLVGDTYGATAGWYLYKQSNNRLGVYYSSLIVDGVTELEANRWYHLAFIRNSGVTSIYIDGVLDKSATDTTNATITQYYIADTAGTSSGELFGYISNLRITRTAVYKQNFTVPKFELKNIPGTILLCCQSSSSTTEAAVSVPGTLTASGDPTATTFAPDLKKDIIDIGTTFEDNTKFDTLSYMVPPGGTTAESNRGRGILFGGGSPGRTSRIDYIEIPNGGNSRDFGDLVCGSVWGSGAGASSTRGVFWGGENQYTKLDYVTIATTANATSFGTSSNQSNQGTCMSSETRAVFVLTGGNIMEYVTIATTGNTTDFGDQGIDDNLSRPAGLASPTRGIVSGGYGPSPYPQSNTIEYITIATTGNGQDFGDLTFGHSGHFGLSNTTRGVFAKGYTFPSPATTYYNTIEYITIASTGNATDFGDATNSVTQGYSHASHTRGVFAAGTAASDINTIDYITIATTGNAQDFGDTHSATRGGSGTSDCHGGIA